MKNRLIVSLISLLNYLFFSVLCVVVFVQNTYATTDVPGGSYPGNTNWTAAGSPYRLTGNVTIPSGATLIIDPGVVVKFGATMAISVSGTLDVQGIEGAPVYFTDIRDDTVGGDTNGDAEDTSPAASGWGGISINDGGSASLNYLEMRYSGRLHFIYNSTHTYCSLLKTGNTGEVAADHLTLRDAGSYGIFLWNTTAAHSFSDTIVDTIGYNAFFLTGATNVTIQDSTIRNSNGDGIYAVSSSGTISGNTIENNGAYGLHVTGNASPGTVAGNTFVGNISGGIGLEGNTTSMVVGASNTLDAIVVTGGTSTADVTWESPFTYRVNSFTVGSGTTLSIPGPRVVKFGADMVISVSGTLDVQGSEGTPVYFTDIRDDTVGGDTNGNGVSSGAAGGWGGISINEGGSASLSYLEMRYSGRLHFIYNSTHTYCSLLKTGNTGEVAADHLTLRDAGNYGIFLWNTTAAHSFSNMILDTIGSRAFFLDGTTDVTIQDSTIQNSGSDGIYAVNSSGTISGNTIANNIGCGIYVNNSAPTITGNTLSNNFQSGIYASGTSSIPDIFGNDIFGNSTGIHCQNGAAPTIGGSMDHRNTIFGNTNFGVNNTSTNVITATYNWWGAYTGPTHADNPGGNGDIVSDNVDFANFIRLSVLTGDMDNDGTIGLSDAVVGLQILTGVPPTTFHPEYVICGIDVNGDNHAGLADINYILQNVAGLNTN